MKPKYFHKLSIEEVNKFCDEFEEELKKYPKKNEAVIMYFCIERQRTVSASIDGLCSNAKCFCNDINKAIKDYMSDGIPDSLNPEINKEENGTIRKSTEGLR